MGEAWKQVVCNRHLSLAARGLYSLLVAEGKTLPMEELSQSHLDTQEVLEQAILELTMEGIIQRTLE